MPDSDFSDSQDRQSVLIPSPIGVLGLEFTNGLATRVEIVPMGARRKLYKPFAALKTAEQSEDLAGARRKLGIGFDLEATGADPFTLRLLHETLKIPYGRTRTYQQLATAIGRPGAYRQVLAALTANPLPLIVPCHRVVPNRAGVGSYVAATAKKEWLLKMERRHLKDG